MLRLNRPANKALFGLLVAVLCTEGLIAQFSSDTRLVVVHASVTDRNGKLVNCRGAGAIMLALLAAAAKSLFDRFSKIKAIFRRLAKSQALPLRLRLVYP